MEFNASAMQAMAKAAQDAFDKLTPEEKAAYRREQAISWAWGQLACMKGGTNEPISKERIGEIYDSMKNILIRK